MTVRSVGEMGSGEMGDLQGVDDAQKRWGEACRREEAIRDLLSRNPDRLKGGGTSRSWLGNWGSVGYGLPNDPTIPGRRHGEVAHGSSARPARRLSYTRQGARRNHPTGDSGLLSEAHQAAIFETVPTDPGELRKSGTSAPNWHTIKTDVEDVDLQTRGRRRGEIEIVKATTPTPGDYRASCWSASPESGASIPN